ncbi:MAG TPA: heparinase II/III family protein [Chthoniobacteraceae bacterium]|nr:heparinase II/III family protein [Chthoniobacteraceae bacterium]
MIRKPKLMKRLIRYLLPMALLMAHPLQWSCDGVEVPKELADRVAELTPHLSPQPVAFGKPISDRGLWHSLSENDRFAGQVKEVEAKAQEAADSALPELPEALWKESVKTKNRPIYQVPFMERTARLAYLVMAECLGNKGRWLPAIEAHLLALLEQGAWSVPAHGTAIEIYRGERFVVDLAAAQIAWSLGTADYWLGEKLPSDLRSRIRSEVRRRVLEPYRRAVLADLLQEEQETHRINWMHRFNNWNAVCHAGVVGSALALLDDPQERAFYIASAEKYLKPYLDNFGEDGFGEEGITYWNYGFSHYILLSEIVRIATNGHLDWMQSPQVAKISQFDERSEILNGLAPGFGDVRRNAKAGPITPVGNFCRWRYGLVKLPPLQQQEHDPSTAPRLVSIHSGLGAQLYRGGLDLFASYSEPLKNPPDLTGGTTGLRSWFPNGGMLICRPHGRQPDGFAVAIKGGNNGQSHNHNDLGSYEVLFGGEKILVDPGTISYFIGMGNPKIRYGIPLLSSYGHPVPRVDGVLQSYGASAKAKTVRTSFSEEQDSWEIDLLDAYEVKGLDHLRRRFVYHRGNAPSLEIMDEFHASRPISFETALIVREKWKATGNNRRFFVGNDRQLMVELSAGENDLEISSDLIEEGMRPTRISARLPAPAKHGIIRTVIRPAPSREPDRSAYHPAALERFIPLTKPSCGIASTRK